MDALKTLIESRRFEATIVALIIVNAITLGLETSPAAVARFGPLLSFLDTAILTVFVAELVARFLVYRFRIKSRIGIASLEPDCSRACQAMSRRTAMVRV